MSFIIVCENLQVFRITEDMIKDYVEHVKNLKKNKNITGEQK